MLGGEDRVGLLLVYWLSCCPTVSLSEVALDVMLRSFLLLVLGYFSVHVEVMRKSVAFVMGGLGPPWTCPR